MVNQVAHIVTRRVFIKTPALLGYSRFCDRVLVNGKRKRNTLKADRGMAVQLHDMLRGQPDVMTFGTSYILGCVEPIMPGNQPAFLVYRTFR
jgi:hypothetical protein